MNEWMNGVLVHDSTLIRLYWTEDNLGVWDEFVMIHASGAGSIARPGIYNAVYTINSVYTAQFTQLSLHNSVHTARFTLPFTQLSLHTQKFTHRLHNTIYTALFRQHS